MRNLSDGQIKLLDQLYTLKVTDNKRQLIYKNNKLIGTKPYVINKSKIYPFKKRLFLFSFCLVFV
jgi:hypothetical protein